MPTPTERISSMLDDVDREAHAKDEAPRRAALLVLAPHIEKARAAEKALDAGAQAHGPRLAELRGLLDRPAMDRVKGFERQQQLGAARRLAGDVAAAHGVAESIRRAIRKCETVNAHTLATRSHWVKDESAWLDGLAHRPVELAELWPKLEAEVARIAEWTTEGVTEPVVMGAGAGATRAAPALRAYLAGPAA